MKYNTVTIHNNNDRYVIDGDTYELLCEESRFCPDNNKYYKMLRHALGELQDEKEKILEEKYDADKEKLKEDIKEQIKKNNFPNL